MSKTFLFKFPIEFKPLINVVFSSFGCQGLTAHLGYFKLVLYARPALAFLIMANLIRTAKSGTDWTIIDLEAYNIVMKLEDAHTFFGLDELPPPSVDQELLTVHDADNMQTERNYNLVSLVNH